MDDRDSHRGPTARRDRRDETADEREDEADRRERRDDLRERVLDRWERELSQRAASMDMLDEAEENLREVARGTRAEAHRQRRADAEARRDASLERDLDRLQDPQSERGGAGTRSGEERVVVPLGQLTELVVRGAPVSDVLHAVLALAVAAVPGTAAASVALVVDGQLQPAACTAPWAGELDAAQLAAGTGPMLDAWRTGDVARSDGPGAAEHGSAHTGTGASERAAVSAALVVGDTTPGVLTVYGPVGHHFDDASVLVTRLLAVQASLAVGWSLDRLSHRAQTEAWERALTSRDQIGQAKGILMAGEHLTADEAFERLRTVSQRLNVKVRDVADHLVTHGRVPDEISRS